MNKARRKEIADIIDKLDALSDLIDEVKEATDSVMSDEQEYFDNMPGGLQESDRGMSTLEVLDQLDSAVNMLDDVDIETLRGYLESASE